MHINFDLGFSVVEVGLSLLVFRADFDMINDILVDVLTRVQSVLNMFSPVMVSIDRLFGDADEMFGLFIVGWVCDQVWRMSVLVDVVLVDVWSILEMVLDCVMVQFGRRIVELSLLMVAVLALVCCRELWMPAEFIDVFD